MLLTRSLGEKCERTALLSPRPVHALWDQDNLRRKNNLAKRNLLVLAKVLVNWVGIGHELHEVLRWKI